MLYEEDTNISDFNIRDVDVEMISKGESGTTLKVSTFLDNYGRSDSSPLLALVKLRDADTNLIANGGNISIGVVKSDTTVVRDIELEVPKDRDYRVELMIFENERIIVEYGVSFFLAPKSSGLEDVTKKTRSVSTTETVTTEFMVESTPEPDYEVYSTKGGYSGPIEEEPGFGIVGALIGIVMVVMLMRKRE